jgi:hypothetical protein
MSRAGTTLVMPKKSSKYVGFQPPVALVATVAHLENCAVGIGSTKGRCAKEDPVAIGDQAAVRTVTACATAHAAASQPDSKKLKTHSEKIQLLRI